jgi:dTDP-4-amino-4,6-dideoxygalactose transaminase
LQSILWAENILARRYFYPGCHRMEPYRSYFPHAGLLLPNTERLAGQVLCLPTGTAVGPDDINKICQVIRLAIDNSNAIKERVSGETAREIFAH